MKATSRAAPANWRKYAEDPIPVGGVFGKLRPHYLALHAIGCIEVPSPSNTQPAKAQAALMRSSMIHKRSPGRPRARGGDHTSRLILSEKRNSPDQVRARLFRDYAPSQSGKSCN